VFDHTEVDLRLFDRNLEVEVHLDKVDSEVLDRSLAESEADSNEDRERAPILLRSSTDRHSLIREESDRKSSTENNRP
jgi:hypothetical protein